MRSLGPAEHLVAGAVGEPGRRTFYIHVVANGVPVWVLAEKQQVAALGEQAIHLLAESDIVANPDAVDQILPRLELVDPDEPDFRVGRMALSVSGDRELVTVIIQSDEEDDGVEFEVAPEQLQAMALKALEVVGQGRPICELCRLPKDPEGHRCPSSNGHHAD